MLRTHTSRPAFRILAAVSLTVALSAGLTGCFNGPGATTNMQSLQATGNGVQAQVGEIDIDGATLVTNVEGNRATLLMRIVNSGTEADRLIGARIDGEVATILSAEGDTVELLPGASLSFAYEPNQRYVNSDNFTAAMSSFVPVQLAFEKSGIDELDVLTVPPVGEYEGIQVPQMIAVPMS